MRKPLIYLAFSGISAILLTSCTATVTQEEISRSGKKIYGVNCSGKAIPMSACYDKAAQLCPRGYTIIAMEAKDPYNPTFPLTQHISRDIGMSLPGVRKGITIKCK